MIFEKENIMVRPLQENDNYLLVRWLSNPAVLEFYEGRDKPFDLEKVNKDFYNRHDGVDRCIVVYEVIAIGYIQFYQVNNKTSTIHDYSQEEITYGMDQFIGEPEYWNKGIGTLLVLSMVDYLLEKKQAHRVIMDPQRTNLRAIRCYEKCGFKKIRVLPKHEFHEGELRDCWLIEFNRSI
ncbi:GNAT family N-acetyltransferase [Oceanobacillus polygoni]|uniref:Aminoglycoside 6'-N-acetyltransferase n=1 Tax=Oceanobacillus polygoni TaxID=1235259 RepID=A0A9X1CDY2_9BACI|nr:GNAT family N-acetyltransferase [Oceanobacillus polygoni]MBP2079541.1 aminoglycoside 6'-N-acetyltransferase [Oceanobacillus polygoni]